MDSIYECLNDKTFTCRGERLRFNVSVYLDDGEDEDQPEDLEALTKPQLEERFVVAISVVVDATDEPYGTLTRNAELTPTPGNVYVRTSEENEDLAEAALATGLFTDTMGRVRSGYILLSEWRVNAWTGIALSYFLCACCGSGFTSSKPPDPQRDTGFGHCSSCHEFVAQKWVDHGFPGVTDLASAKARLAKYA